MQGSTIQWRTGKWIVRCILLAGLLGLTACGPPGYQPIGFTGGYTDEHIRGDVYMVEFSGNDYLSWPKANKYAHRRAKELCVENGYSDYKVLNDVQAGSGFKPKVSLKIQCVK